MIKNNQPIIEQHVVISGKVQGVFYRQSCHDKAIELGIRGWVKNNSNGTVEALFQGSKTTLELMLNWCTRGPIKARVDQVAILSNKDCTDLQKRFTIESI